MVKRDTGQRTMPHSLPSEEALLGAAMLSADALEVLCTEVDLSDFYRPVHQAIAAACNRLYRSGLVTVDPVLVSEEMTPEELRQIDGLGGLMSLQVNVPSTSNSRKYARVIRDMSTLRDLIVKANDIASIAYETTDAATAIDLAREMMGTLDLPVGDVNPSEDIESFMSRSTDYDWVVPGLLERSDRLMLTGGEGEGKSTLLRQLLVAIASGMHPFEYYPFVMPNGEKPTVMLMDCENSENQVRRKLAPLLDIEGVQRRLEASHLRLEIRPEGIDVTKRHDARWLFERVAANKPDVLIIGPVYKLYDGDPNKEEFVRRVISVLDVIRVRYRCALIIEAHSPHGETGRGMRDLRPLGSSMWRRWPEFGFGLAPDVNAERDDPSHPAWFRTWRGSRDERLWPTRLVWADPWPWGVPRDVGRPVHRGEHGYVPDEYDDRVNDF